MFPRAPIERVDLEISYAVHDMWLDELGVALVGDLFRGRKHFRADIGGPDDCPCCVAWDGWTRYDYYPWDDYSWERSAWEEDQDYGDYDRYDYDDPRDCSWASRWVDGKVDTPYDWRDYDGLVDDDHADYYNECCDGQCAVYEGELEHLYGNDNTPDVPGTEVLVAERDAERLKAGDRFYKHRHRTVVKKVA